MARRLQDNSGTDAPGGSYPYGRARDNTGSGNGTPVNEQFIGDITQFFERLMATTSTVANGLPENTTNGFQFITALNAFISSIAVRKIGDSMAGILNMGSNKITNVASGTVSGDAINYGQLTSEQSTRSSADTTLQNNINGKLASGNVAPDDSTVEVVAGVLRVKDAGITASKLGAGAAVSNIGYTPQSAGSYAVFGQSANADSATNDGLYYLFGFNSPPTAGTDFFMLFVVTPISGPYEKIQTAIKVSGGTTVYSRTRTAGVWSSWV